MPVINRVTIDRVDIAERHHSIVVVEREDGFAARSRLFDQPGRSDRSADEAVERLLLSINFNHPKQFECEDAEKRTLLLTWIQDHWKPGRRGNAKRWSSYYLKHVVERAIGEYVGNGELKGAMLAAHFTPTKDSRESDINWDFVLERKIV